MFQIGSRYIIKEFEKTSRACGIKMTPKMMRKFSTNWLRRHGMIPEDVDVITSHVPQSIVARHYLDVSRIHEEYDKATTDLKLLS
ncbi:MAG: integrase [Candidatus Bathyarchaeia archaeon]